MGLTLTISYPFIRHIPIAASLLSPLRHDVPDKTTGRHLFIWSEVCLYGTEREPAAIKYRAAPGAATTGNGDNETPAQSQSERDHVFQREAVAGNESSRQRTCRG